jgi:uncharacterized protein DUF6895
MRGQNRKWDKMDLTRRLCHALDIAKQTVERLALNGYIDSSDSGNNVRAAKVISETAVLLVAASSANDNDQIRERNECVAQLLIPHARSSRMLLGICLESAVAMDYALAHVCLTSLGYPDAGVDELLRQSRGSQVRAGRERVPHRVLEQQWLAALWNKSEQALNKDTPSTALNSVLNQPLDLLSGSREDVYAFTHALMYVTNFGICPARLPRRRNVILAEAEAALGRCLDEDDYDLGGEVLLTWPLTGKSWSAVAAFGFRVLAHVEDKAGFLPAPSTRLQRLNQLHGNHGTDYLLATAYHTTYVMGLLCATALRTGRTPPKRIPTERVVARGSANIILHLLDREGFNPHWREEIEELSDLERDAIAGFLLSVALRRKVKNRELSGVHQLLKSAYAWGLADTPVASQAAEMLERLTTFASIAQGHQFL